MEQDDSHVSSGDSVVDTETLPSTVTSPPEDASHPEKHVCSLSISWELAGLFGEQAWAKVWRVAQAYLKEHPNLETFPEYVPTKGADAGKFLSKPAAFWTCGFFPASLYCLLERAMRYPQYSPRPATVPFSTFQGQLLGLCRCWSEHIHANVNRTNTHDLGFITRSLRMDWELTGDTRSLDSYIKAAESLSTRYDDRVRAIRSWDKTVSHSYEITDREKNFLVIIDSMCNMDLLFYAGHHTGNDDLISKATTHAHTVLRTIVRPDNSTWHLANLDPLNHGKVQFNMTHQGYSNDSTWARGQAWGILGFAQTYNWTGDQTFLSATQRLADYFLHRLSESTAPTHAYVPMWDFDAPAGEDNDSEGQPLRDASAGLIAANGMLLLHEALQSLNPAESSPYLAAALRIVSDTIGYCLDVEDKAKLEVDDHGKVKVAEGKWDAILKHSTANNNKNALMRYSDVGLVYADYYFLEFGNKLLRMGLA